MADVEIYIGNFGPYLVDETDPLLTDNRQVVRRSDMLSGSATVSSETSFGLSASAGSSTSFSKGDHTHGTPANPLAGGVSSATFTTVDGKTVTVINGLITSVV